MPNENRTYLAIDLKSFYASVECVDRGLNPLHTNLVVADESKTDKTICLAVTPSLKAYGISGRPRLFEVVQSVKKINSDRRWKLKEFRFTGSSVFDYELAAHPDWSLDYIVAPPRMARYIDYSARIYETYLKYISADDIYVYSIDEVFMDVTSYLDAMKMTAHQLATTIVRDVLSKTGITATVGIGTNLYLSKVAMDIVAKHIEADDDGVRIASLNEHTYRRLLWSHQPLTDFWRVGRGTERKLQYYGLNTMGDVARMSLSNEALLYHLFGVNAELLIDHAWGWEPCTLQRAKAYKPKSHSLSSGQVLTSAYTADKALVVAKEMAEALSLDLLDNHLVTNQVALYVGYDAESLTNPATRDAYQGVVSTDHYGRKVPKHSQGGAKLKRFTSSTRIITKAVTEIFNQVVNKDLFIRRINITVNNVMDERRLIGKKKIVQLNLFTDYEALRRKEKVEKEALAKERRLMETTIRLKKKFGKNSILKGLNYLEGATARERNLQIGGHKA